MVAELLESDGARLWQVVPTAVRGCVLLDSGDARRRSGRRRAHFRSSISQSVTGLSSASGIFRSALNMFAPSFDFCSGNPSCAHLLTAWIAWKQSRYGARVIDGKMVVRRCCVTSLAPSQQRCGL